MAKSNIFFVIIKGCPAAADVSLTVAKESDLMEDIALLAVDDVMVFALVS
jgi:hypothetical protein